MSHVRNKKPNRILVIGLALALACDPFALQASAAGLPQTIVTADKFQIPDGIRLPKEIGSVKKFKKFEGSDRFVVLIQDAHAIFDAQKSIEGLIRHLKSKHSFSVIGIEAAAGDLDATLLRTFPDESLKKKAMDFYLQQGELTGPQMNAIFDQDAAVYSGIEDWKLYEENFRAYMKALEAQEAAAEEIAAIRKEMDAKRLKVYGEDLNLMHEKYWAYREDGAKLLDYLNFLRETADHGSDWAEIVAKYPEVSKLLASMAREKTFNHEKIDAAVRACADDFRIRHVRKLSKRKSVQFTNAYQQYVTGRSAAPVFLKVLRKLARGLKVELALDAEVQDFLAHGEILAAIHGTELFNELEALSLEIENRLIEKKGERELASHFRDISTVRDLVMLQLTHEQFAEVRANLPRFESLLKDPKRLEAGLRFYELAVRRDEALFRNLTALMNRTSKKAAAAVLGGFHSEGFESLLAKEKISYAVLTPAIKSLDGQEKYRTVMEGKLSYRDMLKTTYYDGFIRHSSLRLMSKLPEPEFRNIIKFWRDQIIRGLALEGKTAKSADYTRYLDLLMKIYLEKFGAKNTLKKTRSEIEKEIRSELRSSMDRLKQKSIEDFMPKFEFFAGGAARLAASGEINLESIQALMKDAAAFEPQTLGVVVALAPNSPVLQLAPAPPLAAASPASPAVSAALPLARTERYIERLETKVLQGATGTPVNETRVQSMVEGMNAIRSAQDRIAGPDRPGDLPEATEAELDAVVDQLTPAEAQRVLTQLGYQPRVVYQAASLGSESDSVSQSQSAGPSVADQIIQLFVEARRVLEFSGRNVRGIRAGTDIDQLIAAEMNLNRIAVMARQAIADNPGDAGIRNTMGTHITTAAAYRDAVTAAVNDIFIRDTLIQNDIAARYADAALALIAPAEASRVRVRDFVLVQPAATAEAVDLAALLYGRIVNLFNLDGVTGNSISTNATAYFARLILLQTIAAPSADTAALNRELNAIRWTADRPRTDAATIDAQQNLMALVGRLRTAFPQLNDYFNPAAPLFATHMAHTAAWLYEIIAPRFAAEQRAGEAEAQAVELARITRTATATYGAIVNPGRGGLSRGAINTAVNDLTRAVTDLEQMNAPRGTQLAVRAQRDELTTVQSQYEAANRLFLRDIVAFHSMPGARRNGAQTPVPQIQDEPEGIDLRDGDMLRIGPLIARIAVLPDGIRIFVEREISELEARQAMVLNAGTPAGRMFFVSAEALADVRSLSIREQLTEIFGTILGSSADLSDAVIREVPTGESRVSRMHSAVFANEEGLRVTDLRSKNGTTRIRLSTEASDQAPARADIGAAAYAAYTETYRELVNWNPVGRKVPGMAQPGFVQPIETIRAGEFLRIGGPTKKATIDLQLVYASRRDGVRFMFYLNNERQPDIVVSADALADANYVINLGRGKENQLRVRADIVSGIHAQITVGENEVGVFDMNSTNGTSLHSFEKMFENLLEDGTRNRRALTLRFPAGAQRGEADSLDVGDMFRIGSHHFLVTHISSEEVHLFEADADRRGAIAGSDFHILPRRDLMGKRFTVGSSNANLLVDDAAAEPIHAVLRVLHIVSSDEYVFDIEHTARAGSTTVIKKPASSAASLGQSPETGSFAFWMPTGPDTFAALVPAQNDADAVRDLIELMRKDALAKMDGHYGAIADQLYGVVQAEIARLLERPGFSDADLRQWIIDAEGFEAFARGAASKIGEIGSADPSFLDDLILRTQLSIFFTVPRLDAAVQTSLKKITAADLRALAAFLDQAESPDFAGAVQAGAMELVEQGNPNASALNVNASTFAGLKIKQPSVLGIDMSVWNALSADDATRQKNENYLRTISEISKIVVTYSRNQDRSLRDLVRTLAVPVSSVLHSEYKPVKEKTFSSPGTRPDLLVLLGLDNPVELSDNSDIAQSGVQAATNVLQTVPMPLRSFAEVIRTALASELKNEFKDSKNGFLIADEDVLSRLFQFFVDLAKTNAAQKLVARAA